MSKICDLTGKRPIVGNHVSHSNRKTKRRFNPNLVTKRIFIPELKKWVTLKLAASALRTMNKLGVYAYLKRQLDKGFDPYVWLDNPKASNDAKRGYRRVEETNKDGSKTARITYEPNVKEVKKVKLSSIVK